MTGVAALDASPGRAYPRRSCAALVIRSCTVGGLVAGGREVPALPDPALPLLVSPLRVGGLVSPEPPVPPVTFTRSVVLMVEI